MSIMPANITDETKQNLSRQGESEQKAQESSSTTINESRRDAGVIARNKLKQRAEHVKRLAFNLYMSIASFIAIFAVAFSVYVYQHTSKTSRFVTDIRPCSYKYTMGNNEYEITGNREYSYPSKSLFGIDYRLQEDVKVTTKLDVRGDTMSVTGISSSGWWTLFIDQGERGIQILKPAELYVMTIGKNTLVFHDKEFCR